MEINTDKLNFLLLFFALGLAYIIPFQLFLLSYVILGPLHYITEINWIHKRAYFVKTKSWVFLCVVLCVLISIPQWYYFFKEINFNKTTDKFINEFQGITNIFIYLGLLFAIYFTYSKAKKTFYIFAFICILIGYILLHFSTFNLLIGILLPTIIHVYIFTLFFMWYGSIKSKSKIGFLNVAFLASIPILIIYLPTPDFLYKTATSYVVETYTNTKFYVLNLEIAKLLQLSDGKSFNFSDIITTKIQIFISFAYTYHYLNWFSKTNSIGWHKGISKKKIKVIIFLWIFSILLYAFDYKLGLISLFFLSYMHIFIEFPVNIIAIREVATFYFKKIL